MRAGQIALTFTASVILFPLAQISLFGLTDYRRPADLIVVFGARADGRPSDTLADRVRTSAQRYGLEVFTVPAKTTVPGSMPFNIAREDVAFWAYYLRRLTSYNAGTSTGPRIP